MPVTIRILSGARQGEEIHLEAREFRIGASPECEVRFDPQADPSAQGRLAKVRQRDDGWYVGPGASGSLIVNRSSIAVETRLRSGDVLRMSPDGPDLSFGITAHAPAPRLETLRRAASKPPEAPPQAVSAPCDRNDPISPAPVEASAPGPDSVPAESRRGVWMALGVAAAVLLVVVGWWTAGFGRHGGGPVARGPEAAPETNGKPEVKIAAIDNQPPRRSSDDAAALQVADDPWARVEEELRKAVFLVFVEAGDEKKSHLWPFATCTAIGDFALLTTARETLQLALWRRQGQRIWVSRSVDGPKIAVKDFRVHQEFVSLADKPGDWIHANLGLLVTEEKLPGAARLASLDDLQELEEGLPLSCFGFSHDGGKITRFHKLEPRLYRGEVYLLGDPFRKASPLRLLEMKAEIPENVYGSPVVDGQGRVVGVYGEAAPAQALGVKNLHYATVLDVALLQSWLAGSERGWLPPPMDAIQAGRAESPSP